MLCLSGFALYSRWVPLIFSLITTACIKLSVDFKKDFSDFVVLEVTIKGECFS